MLDLCLGKFKRNGYCFFKSMDCLNGLGIVNKNRRISGCRNHKQVGLLAAVDYFKYYPLFLLYEALVMSFQVFKKILSMERFRKCHKFIALDRRINSLKPSKTHQ